MLENKSNECTTLPASVIYHEKTNDNQQTLRDLLAPEENSLTDKTHLDSGETKTKLLLEARHTLSLAVSKKRRQRVSHSLFLPKNLVRNHSKIAERAKLKLTKKYTPEQVMAASDAIPLGRHHHNITKEEVHTAIQCLRQPDMPNKYEINTNVENVSTATETPATIATTGVDAETNNIGIDLESIKLEIIADLESSEQKETPAIYDESLVIKQEILDSDDEQQVELMTYLTHEAETRPTVIVQPRQHVGYGEESLQRLENSLQLLSMTEVYNNPSTSGLPKFKDPSIYHSELQQIITWQAQRCKTPPVVTTETPLNFHKEYDMSSTHEPISRRLTPLPQAQQSMEPSIDEAHLAQQLLNRVNPPTPIALPPATNQAKSLHTLLAPIVPTASNLNTTQLSQFSHLNNAIDAHHPLSPANQLPTTVSSSDYFRQPTNVAQLPAPKMYDFTLQKSLWPHLKPIPPAQFAYQNIWPILPTPIGQQFMPPTYDSLPTYSTSLPSQSVVPATTYSTNILRTLKQSPKPPQTTPLPINHQSFQRQHNRSHIRAQTWPYQHKNVAASHAYLLEQQQQQNILQQEQQQQNQHQQLILQQQQQLKIHQQQHIVQQQLQQQHQQNVLQQQQQHQQHNILQQQQQHQHQKQQQQQNVLQHQQQHQQQNVLQQQQNLLQQQQNYIRQKQQMQSMQWPNHQQQHQHQHQQLAISHTATLQTQHHTVPRYPVLNQQQYDKYVATLRLQQNFERDMLRRLRPPHSIQQQQLTQVNHSMYHPHHLPQQHQQQTNYYELLTTISDKNPNMPITNKTSYNLPTMLGQNTCGHSRQTVNAAGTDTTEMYAFQCCYNENSQRPTIPTATFPNSMNLEYAAPMTHMHASSEFHYLSGRSNGFCDCHKK